jgi:hypothetical protein
MSTSQRVARARLRARAASKRSEPAAKAPAPYSFSRLLLMLKLADGLVSASEISEDAREPRTPADHLYGLTIFGAASSNVYP